jgi:hypothetical protein
MPCLGILEKAPPASTGRGQSRVVVLVGGDCRGSLPRLMDLATGRRGRVGVFQLVGRERGDDSLMSRRAELVWERAALKLEVDGLARLASLIADDPDHNQSVVDVSYIAQTPDGQRRKRITNRNAIATRSAFNSTYTGTCPGVRGLAPKHVGRKETPCNYLQFCKENR